jgi:hypothetical protein
VGRRVKNPKPNLAQEKNDLRFFFPSRLYLGNTSTDTGQDGETLLVDILTEDAPVENGVLLIGGKLGGTLRSLDHNGRDNSTVKRTEPTRMKKI